MESEKAGEMMLYELLCEKLDPRSGCIQDKAQNDTGYWQTAFDIVWKGRIRFIVTESPHRRHFGHYYVMRDGQLLSPDFTYTKLDDALIRRMQHMINEIESGKYAGKKTLSEKVRAFVAEKGLTSYMNHTKWRALCDALSEKLPDIEIQYKSLFDDAEPDTYWEFYGDEELNYIHFAQIEWMKIRQTITAYHHKGRLLPPEIQTDDKKETIAELLTQHHIPYEYHETEQVFVVYGYK